MNKKCPNCQDDLAEVQDVYLEEDNIYLIKDVKAVDLKFSLFPIRKIIPNSKQTYKEYRFVCFNCKKEFTYNTFKKEFKDVEEDSEFIFSWKLDCLVKRKD
jgi:hypothetical protein